MDKGNDLYEYIGHLVFRFPKKGEVFRSLKLTELLKFLEKKPLPLFLILFFLLLVSDGTKDDPARSSCVKTSDVLIGSPQADTGVPGSTSTEVSSTEQKNPPQSFGELVKPPTNRACRETATPPPPPPAAEQLPNYLSNGYEIVQRYVHGKRKTRPTIDPEEIEYWKSQAREEEQEETSRYACNPIPSEQQQAEDKRQFEDQKRIYGALFSVLQEKIKCPTVQPSL